MSIERATRDGRVYGEGDTYLVEDLLPPELATKTFEDLKNEVQWQTMYHQGG